MPGPLPRRTRGGWPTTTESLRRANLSAILGIVHRGGQVSRAELARSTGLTRATVGAVVAELVELGLVFESHPGGGERVGRPSYVVHPDPGAVAVAVNPEVDSVHVGLVELGGRVRARERIAVPEVPSARQVVELAAASSARLLAELGRPARVVGSGVAVPGQVRGRDGLVREATHFGWREEPIARLFEAATGHRALAANAARLAMQAELTFGAGRGVDDLFYVIGGASGIGGGAVVGGRLLTGSAGYAAEVGHTFVRDGGAPCHCGSRGCLEAEVTQQRLLDAVGLPPDRAHELADALAASSDARVRAIVEDGLAMLGVAVRNVVNLFNPSVVVVSGFLDALLRAQPGADLGEGVVRSARDGLRIVPAELGSDHLLIGAAELVFAELVADPAAVRAAG